MATVALLKKLNECMLVLGSKILMKWMYETFCQTNAISEIIIG